VLFLAIGVMLAVVVGYFLLRLALWARPLRALPITLTTHVDPATGQRVPACRPVALVMSHDPQTVRCPQCREDLRKLATFLAALQAGDEAAHVEEHYR
jgi:hypothetical protein